MFYVPAVCCGIAVFCGLWKGRSRPGFWRHILTAVCVQYAGLFLIYLFLRRFAAGSEGFLPLSAVCALCLPPYLARILSLFDRDSRAVIFCKRLGLAAAVLILCEILLFNGVSFTGEWKSRQYGPEELAFTGVGEAQGNEYLITTDGTLVFEHVPAYARCLLLSLEQEEGVQVKPYTLTLLMRDGNFTESYWTVQEKRQRGSGALCRLSFTPYGEEVSLRLRFEGVTAPVSLRSVTAASCLPFRFQALRFWALFILAGAFLAVIGFSLYRVRYRREKWTHLLCVGVTVALCIGFGTAFAKPVQTPYPYEGTPTVDDPFALSFDAFRKGQVWLDLTPDEGLADLDNVYSYDQRKASGVDYRWDLAYYEGKYYSYFGVTPVLTYYYPYYWITGKLPDPATPVGFFAFGSILMLCLTLLTGVRFFARRPNLLLLLLSLVAVTLCCGALYAVNDQAPKYQLPLISGLFWLCACLFAGMRGYLAEKMSRRMLWLFVSGTSLALCFGARPTMALNAAWLIPLFVGILCSRCHKPIVRIGQAVCFLVPLAVGGLGLMWYNQARFGAPFDFGAAWQLTVSDVHANSFRLTNLPAALIHYFLMPPALSPIFPFFEPHWGYLSNYQQYVYLEGVVGWLAYPMILLGLVWLYPAVRDAKARRLGAAPWQRRSMLLLCWLLPVLLALADFSMGGVNQRYLYDIVPLLMIGSTAAILHRCRRPEGDRHIYVLSCMAVIATALFGVLLLLTYPEGNVMKAHPDLYNRVEEMAVFWQ